MRFFTVNAWYSVFICPLFCSVDNLRQFAQGLLDDTLPEFIGKSEPVPARNDGPVKIVVANNFRKIVDQDKDVLIEFYAPWYKITHLNV